MSTQTTEARRVYAWRLFVRGEASARWRRPLRWNKDVVFEIGDEVDTSIVEPRYARRLFERGYIVLYSK